MKISYRWLKDYLSIDLEPHEIAKMLTDIGLEVEALEQVEHYPGGLKGVFVGEVIQCEKHPQADRLHLTTVNIGSAQPLHIVCGAPNVASGQKVLVATLGSQVQFGTERVTLKPTKIRGEQSEGMICAEDELGLGRSHEGIMVLPDDAQPGTPAANYLGLMDEWVFEIGLTPNRADAASHMGVARDLLAALNNQAYLEGTPARVLTLPSIEGFCQDDNELPMQVEVLDTPACPRYAGLTMTGIRVAESPAWLKERLIAIGLRPINNLVDISNYVLHETGQPLHLFDADKIREGKVVVRKAVQGSRFTTLDEQERVLHPDDLMICDAQKELCLAGIFGGRESGVNDQTTRVFIESACFDPVHVRKSSRRHGLKTDASFRFERGTDPEMVLFAMKRAALLIRELAGGKISSPVYDLYPEPLPPFQVRLRYAMVEKLIGTSIPHDHIKNIIGWLGIQITLEMAGEWMLAVPRYKVDVTREADVIEEILRIYGYNTVPMPAGVSSSLAYISQPDEEKLRERVSDMLSGQGFHEIMCNSLTNSRHYKLVDSWDVSRCVTVLNPISQDLDVMRQTLLFGGLETIAYNRNRRQNDLKLFEFGNVYQLTSSPADGSGTLSRFFEAQHLCILLTGNRYPESWQYPLEEVSYFDLKAAVNNVFLRLGLVPEEQDSPVPAYLQYGVELQSQGRSIGWMGKLADAVTKVFNVNSPVFYAELTWQEMCIQVPENPMEYKPVPRFPAVRRDLALVVDRSVSYENLRECAFRTVPGLLRSVNLFDVYEGKSIGSDKKSYAVSFILRDEEKTLTDNVIDATMAHLLKAFEKELGASLRV